MASVQITSRRQAEDMLISKAQQDESFRKELVANPRAAIGRQLGITLPAELDIKVVEETARSLYIVLPPTSRSRELAAEELATVAGGNQAETQMGNFEGSFGKLGPIIGTAESIQQKQ